jgi:hypothetical protein
MIYIVSSWPSVPYEGGNYFNVPKNKLGVYRGGRWSYYDPFTAKLPIDSYDLDFDGIPDEFDPETVADYPGSGPYTNPNGYIIPIGSYLNPVGKSLVNNSTVTSVKTSDCEGLLILADGGLHFFQPGDVFDFPPQATMFCGTYLDSDSDGIVDPFDTNVNYPGSGPYDGGVLDPSLLLSPLNGDGSTNQTSTSVKITTKDGGFTINPDGSITYFGLGDVINYSPSTVVFFGTFSDADGDGIPDGVDLDAGYPGAGDFSTCTGVDPSLFLVNVDSGSTNSSSTTFSTTARKSGIIITANCELFIFNSGQSIEVNPNDTVFFGDSIIDSDADSLPNPVDIPTGYTNGNFTFDIDGDGTDDITTSINVKSLFTSHDSGSYNGIGRKYRIIAKDDGVTVSTAGAITIFQKNQILSVEPTETVFFGDVLDSDGDGIPDSLGTVVPFTQDPLVTSGGSSVNIGEIMTPPYVLVKNTSNPPTPLTMGPFPFPVALIGPNGSVKTIPEGTVFTLLPGWILCKPEITSTQSANTFFTTANDSASLQSFVGSSNGFKSKHFSQYDPETLQLNANTFTDTVNFDDSFEIEDLENITFKNP